MAEQGYSNGVLTPRPQAYPPNGALTNEHPSKKPRLSPQPQTMNSYTSPQVANYRQTFSPTQYAPISPAPPLQSGATNHNITFPSAPGNMGPPEKPKADKQLDISALNDMVALAGVDLKKEEDYMVQVYRNQHTQSTANNNSFGSYNSWPSNSPQGSFNQWSQSPTATQLSNTSHAHGPLAQAPLTPEALQAQVKARHQKAADLQARTKQQHLSDPFLLPNILREKIQKQTLETAVRFRDDSTRLAHEVQAHDFIYQNRRWHINTDTAIISAETHIVSADSTLPNILTLLSLAAQSRIRDVLEDSYAASRSRQYGSGGQVPPDWLDVATAPTEPEQTLVKPESVSKTAWDAIPKKSDSPTALGKSSLLYEMFTTCTNMIQGNTLKLTDRTLSRLHQNYHQCSLENIPPRYPQHFNDLEMQI
jgi:hypothetical protein